MVTASGSHTSRSRWRRTIAATCGLMLVVFTSAAAQQSPHPVATSLADQSQDEAGILPPPEPPALSPPPADAAQPQSASEHATSSELADILARLEALEASMKKPTENAAAEKPAPEKPAAEKSLVDDWVDLSGEKWTVKFGGHVQLDFIHWPNADDPPVPAQDYFEFRRLRLVADGVGIGVYDFRLQIDFEPESGDGVPTPVTDVKDAYFTMHEIPCLQRWRIGNFFVPFSLEQVTNDTNNIFMERSIPTQNQFAADREVGMAVYGTNDAKNVTWAFGTFLDGISESLKERIDDNQGQRLSGRLTWLPYYDEPSNGRYLVHTGAGILYTDDFDGLVRFRARPQIHEGPFLIDTGNFAAGSYTSGNIELATVWGPFSVQSEMFLCNVNRIAEDSANLYGAYVYASYFLTGENRVYERFGQHGAQFGRTVPFSNFFWVPGCCGPGAWEVKARYSNFNVENVDSGQYNDLTTGFNWYWSDRVRIMFDYIHPVTSAASTPFGATVSDIIAMRFDFNW